MKKGLNKGCSRSIIQKYKSFTSSLIGVYMPYSKRKTVIGLFKER